MLKKFLNERIEDKNIRSGLGFSIYDGILWAIMFGFAENYIVPFIKYFGASNFQLTLVQGLAQLGAGLGQLFGAFFIIHYLKRRKLCIAMNAVHSISWVMVFVLTVLTHNYWFAIIFFFLGVLFANIGVPGWLSWMNDTVPVKLRGEFYGIRNKIIVIVQFIAISIAGITLQIGQNINFELAAFGVLFIAAFVSRFSSVIPLSKQYEPKFVIQKFTHEFTFLKFLTKLFTTNFGKFAVFSILMTFSVNLLGPLQAAYLLKKLNFNYIQFTVVTMVPFISTFIFMTYWGPLTDKYGNYRILFLTAALLPFLSLAWTFFSNFYVIIFIQIVGGFVLAGFNLSTVNFIFDAVRKENISKVMAYFNTLNTVFAFLGSLVCGLLADFFLKLFDNPVFNLPFFNNYTIVFLISTLARGLVLIILIKNFKEVRPVEESPRFHFFYIYKPAENLINWVIDMNEKISKKGKKIISKIKKK